MILICFVKEKCKGLIFFFVCFFFICFFFVCFLGGLKMWYKKRFFMLFFLYFRVLKVGKSDLMYLKILYFLGVMVG